MTAAPPLHRIFAGGAQVENSWSKFEYLGVPLSTWEYLNLASLPHREVTLARTVKPAVYYRSYHTFSHKITLFHTFATVDKTL